MSPPGRDWLVAFDLDDTLYPEAAFIRSGFQAVERGVQGLLGTVGFADRAWALYQQGEREAVFERTLREMGLPYDVATRELVERIYLSHTPNIAPYPDVMPALETLHLRAAVAILTDGMAALQQRKINALRLEHFVHRVVLTDEWGREFWKPHPRGYQELQDWLGLPPHRCLYVGDNPLKDFTAARELGWQCLRVRRRDGQHAAVDVPNELGMIPYCRDFSNFEEFVMPRRPDASIEM